MAIALPPVMIHLEKAIEHLGVSHACDAYRRHSHAGSVAILVDVANEGEAEFLEEVPLPHVYDLSKPWLQTVPGGLIPENLAHRPLMRDESLDLVVEIELLHQNVLKHRIGLLRHAAGYVEDTLMGTVALAMEFEPLVSFNEISANRRPIQDLICRLIQDRDLSECWPLAIPAEHEEVP
jgi:hypothetical protein